MLRFNLAWDLARNLEAFMTRSLGSGVPRWLADHFLLIISLSLVCRSVGRLALSPCLLGAPEIASCLLNTATSLEEIFLDIRRRIFDVHHLVWLAELRFPGRRVLDLHHLTRSLPVLEVGSFFDVGFLDQAVYR